MKTIGVIKAEVVTAVLWNQGHLEKNADHSRPEDHEMGQYGSDELFTRKVVIDQEQMGITPVSGS